MEQRQADFERARALALAARPQAELNAVNYRLHRSMVTAVGCTIVLALAVWAWTFFQLQGMNAKLTEVAAECRCAR
jgi:hypothetical protein